MDRRASSGSVGGQSDGNPLTGPITRDEVFNLLEEKADKKDLEKRMTSIVTRYGTCKRFGIIYHNAVEYNVSVKTKNI